MTDYKLAVSQEARIITRAGKCGHHHDADCEACQSALDYNNKSLDEMRAEVAEARLAGERAGKWQDIASAPKDGTVILLAFEDGDERIVRSGGFCEETGVPIVHDSDWPFIEPIAWQPLPEPPALPAQSDDSPVRDSECAPTTPGA